MRVVVETGGVSSQVTLSGPLLLNPPGFKVLRRAGGEVTIAPAEVLGSDPDVLIGLLPLIYLADGKQPTLEELWLAPPSPFTDKDIQDMWSRVERFPLIDVSGLSAQGRYGVARLAGRRASGVGHEFLVDAHNRARRLIANWPTDESQTLMWRSVELRGGREDFALTERLMAGVPAAVRSDGTHVPQRTVRRRAAAEPWGSWALHHSASHLVRALRALEEPSDDVGLRLSTTIATLGDRARPCTSRSDAPISAWPTPARLCYAAVVAALSAIGKGAGPAKAPLGHLWRLYEAWIATLVYDALVASLGEPARALHRPGGCECAASWLAPDGAEVTFMAHPRIGRVGSSPRNSPAAHVVSVSSDLVPDAAILVRRHDRVDFFVVDAKRRVVSTKMEPVEVAEAASKYLWGIRSASEVESFAVTSALIVSSMQPGPMHDTAAKIAPICAMPSHRDDLNRAVDRAVRPPVGA